MLENREGARKGRWMVRASSLGLTIAIMGTAQPVLAQDAEVGEVIVSGTRTVRDGSQAPTPVTVISAGELENSSPRNFAEGLASLPAFRGSTGTTTPALSTQSNNTGSFLNLRALGNQRTLVLLDGRRLVPSSNLGAINFNLIPQSLIQRVDVVTGGASAAYGSDAVAGVVNVILQTNFEGIKGTLQAGRSDHGDMGSQKATLTFGKTFADDRFHVVASALWNHTDPIFGASSARGWASKGLGRLIVGTGSAAYSEIFENVNQINYRGGVVLTGATNSPFGSIYPTGVKFLEGGVPSPYDRGSFITTTNQVGGDGSRNTNSLAGGLDQATFFGRATFDLSDSIELFGQVILAKATNVYQPSTNQNVTATQMTIFETNPFIPAQLQTVLAASTPTGSMRSFSATTQRWTTVAAAGGSTQCGLAALDPASAAAFGNLQAAGSTITARCFKMSRIHQEEVGGVKRITNNADNETVDLSAGFTASLGDYRLSGYVNRGENDFNTRTQYNAYWDHFFAAVDAIRTTAGDIRCAVTTPTALRPANYVGAAYDPAIAALYAGCEPLNVFGFNSSTEAARNFAFVTSWYRTNIVQNVAALDLAGDVFELPAGPLAFAIGAEYKTVEVDQTADPGNTALKLGRGVRGFPTSLYNLPGAYNFGNASVYAGKLTVKELYTELNAPLLKDLPLISEFSVNAAGRYTDYSNSGGVKTYKIGLSYKPIESLRFRGTYSRDIRAPNLNELFQGNGQGAQTVMDPFDNNRTVNILGSVRGNQGLKPEEADTYAYGVVFQPTFLPGFTASLDYYNITLMGAIGTLTTQDTVNQCYGTNGTDGNQSLCANVIRDGSGTIISVLQPYLNLQELTTNGVDLEVGWRGTFPGAPGQVFVRGLVGYVGEVSSQAVGSAKIDRTGQVGNGVSNPRYRGQATFGWESTQWGATWDVNVIGKGVLNRDYRQAFSGGTNTIRDNTVPTVTTHDLSLRYKFGEELAYEAFGTINNFFDKDPARAPGNNSANFIQSNFELYDTIGRYYTAGIRFRF